MSAQRRFVEFYFLDHSVQPDAPWKAAKPISIDRSREAQLIELPDGTRTVTAPEDAVACRFFKIAADEAGKPVGERQYDARTWYFYDRVSVGSTYPIRDMDGERFDVVAAAIGLSDVRMRAEYLQFEPPTPGSQIHRFRIPPNVLAAA